MAILTTFDWYSPFGAAMPSDTDIDCEFTDDLVRGGQGQSITSTVTWSHYIDFADAVSVLDGITRTESLNTLNYADGDEVRIDGVRYVVVWVTQRNDGFGTTIKRAYLLRHTDP